jgi:hypothetical protein
VRCQAAVLLIKALCDPRPIMLSSDDLACHVSCAELMTINWSPRQYSSRVP